MNWWVVKSCCNFEFLDWLLGWTGFYPSKSKERVWNVLYCAVAWTIWEYQNKVVFQGLEANVSMALDLIKFRVVW